MTTQTKLDESHEAATSDLNEAMRYSDRIADAEIVRGDFASAGHALGPTAPMKSLLLMSKSQLKSSEVNSDVRRLVTICKERNSRHGITGAMICTFTHFAQYLEGTQLAVDQVTEQLQKDLDHDDLRIIARPIFTRRYFSDWGIAYCGSSIFISTLVGKAFEGRAPISDANKLIRLMREFRNDGNAPPHAHRKAVERI